MTKEFESPDPLYNAIRLQDALLKQTSRDRDREAGAQWGGQQLILEG